MEIRYPWHGLFGHRLRVVYREARADGEVLVCETDASELRAIPAWMADEVTCAILAVGPPAVEARALVELHELLATARVGVTGASHTEEPSHAEAFDAPARPTPNLSDPADEARNVPVAGGSGLAGAARRGVDPSGGDHRLGGAQ